MENKTGTSKSTSSCRTPVAILMEELFKEGTSPSIQAGSQAGSGKLLQTSWHRHWAEVDVSVPPAEPRVGGLRWLHAEPSLTCSSARDTDPNQGHQLGENDIGGGSSAPASPNQVPKRASQASCCPPHLWP